jgi:hypothetical protein
MNRLEIAQLTRFLIDQLPTDWFKDTSATEFDILQALQLSYDQYAEATECFEAAYTLAATVDKHTYVYDDFDAGLAVAGTHAAPVDAFTSLTAHGFLEADEVRFATTNGNITAGSTYFVKYSSATAFQVALVPGGTAIVLAAHSNTVYANAARRMFELVAVAYDSKALEETTIANLAATDANWRFSESSTPRFWIPAGERKVRLWPPPPDTSNIDSVAYETPPRRFGNLPSTAGDYLEPDIHSTNHRLISIGAAILPLLRNPNIDNQVRMSPLYQELTAGYKAAKKRIHGSGRAQIIVGRRGTQGRTLLPLTARITPYV